MGWPIYVMVWHIERYGREYAEVYGGRSWIKAILAACKAKREGAGCIKLEWR